MPLTSQCVGEHVFQMFFFCYPLGYRFNQGFRFWKFIFCVASLPFLIVCVAITVSTEHTIGGLVARLFIHLSSGECRRLLQAISM